MFKSESPIGADPIIAGAYSNIGFGNFPNGATAFNVEVEVDCLAPECSVINRQFPQ